MVDKINNVQLLHTACNFYRAWFFYLWAGWCGWTFHPVTMTYVYRKRWSRKKSFRFHLCEWCGNFFL